MTELEGVQEMLDISLNEQVVMHKNIMDLQAELKALAVAAQSCLETNDMEYLWEALDLPNVKKFLKDE